MQHKKMYNNVKHCCRKVTLTTIPLSYPPCSPGDNYGTRGVSKTGESKIQEELSYIDCSLEFGKDI